MQKIKKLKLLGLKLKELEKRLDKLERSQKSFCKNKTFWQEVKLQVIIGLISLAVTLLVKYL